MRTISANAQTKLNTQFATEPSVILKIEWTSGTLYYGDKSYTLTPNTIQGKILEFSPVQATGKQDSGGEISSASVTLDDIDGTLKNIWNRTVIEGVNITAYHHFEGNAWADLTLLFKGKIAGPVVWSEGERTLTFEMETYTEDAEVGYAPEVGDIPNLNPDVAGTMWPIVFGAVRHVKTVQVLKGALGTNTEGIYGGYPNYDAVPFKVDNGNLFPQGTNIHIVVANTRFFGYFDGDLFHRSISNIPWYENITLGTRIQLDPDTGNKAVAWVANNEYLAHKYCYIDGIGFRFCTKQEGSKCFFESDWPVLLDSTHIVASVCGDVREEWYTDPALGWLVYWYIKPKQLVYEYEKTYNDLYIVNEYPSTEVVEVSAWRTFGDQKIFVQIPSSYYTIHLNYSYNGKNVTAIELNKPLYYYEDQKWEEDIYVSLRSTLSSNTADAIKWLIETYSAYSVDATSFAQVKLDVGPYPSNFALFDQRNLIDLIEDIAWQARCAIYIHDGTIGIKYLSKSPDIDYNITNADVLLKQLKVGCISTDDLVTKLTTTWRTDYVEGETGVLTTEPTNKRKVIYKNNIDTFGLREQEREVFIYNIEALVVITTNFWGYRYSNSWRTTELPTIIKPMGLELFDCVGHVLPTFSGWTIRGVIEEISHDTADIELVIKTVTCSRMGLHSDGEPVEDPYFWIGDPANPVTPQIIEDPLKDLATVNYIPPVYEDGSATKVGDQRPTDTYKYVFIEPTADEIERGTNFTITIQIQDTIGNVMAISSTGRLSLHSEDEDDKLTTGVIEKDITFTSGIFTTTTEQITGGTTVVSGYLSCIDKLLRDNYTDGQSSGFIITDVKSGVLTWSTNPPATVKRGVLFTVDITGGVAGEIIDVTFLGTDIYDRLYLEDGTHIESITLGVGGSYTASWYISGGDGAEAGCSIRLSDSRYQKYANATSTTFAISATNYVMSLIQTIPINPAYQAGLEPGDNNSDYSGGGVKLNPNTLTLTKTTGEVDDGTEFTIYAVLKDSNDNILDYDGEIRFAVVDGDADALAWQLPIASQVYITNMSNGELTTGFAVSLPTGTTSPIEIAAQVVYNGETITGLLTLPFMAAQQLIQTIEVGQTEDRPVFDFSLSTDVAAITRGVAFNLTIQARNQTTGEFDTTYVPTGNVTISASTKSDSSDVLTPTYTDATGWSNGAKTVSCTISGGSGNDSLEITVYDVDTDRTGILSVIIGTNYLTTHSDTRKLHKIKHYSSYPTPITQTLLDSILTDTMAVTPTVYTGTETYFNNLSMRGGGYQDRDCVITRIACVFDTTSVVTGTKCSLELYTGTIGLTNLPYLRNYYDGSANVYWCQLHDELLRGIYVAKGTWVGSIATTTDWDSYSDAIYYPRLELRRRVPDPDETIASSAWHPSYSWRGGRTTIEVPTSWINYGGKTKLMMLARIDPNPFQITDIVGHGSSYSGEFLDVNDPTPFRYRLLIGG